MSRVKFDILQVNLLCDEDGTSDMMTLPKVAFEALVDEFKPILKHILRIGGKEEGYAVNEQAHVYDPRLDRWNQLNVILPLSVHEWPLKGGSSYSYATPIGDGSVIICHNAAPKIDSCSSIFRRSASHPGSYEFELLSDEVQDYIGRADSSLITMHDGRVACIGGFDTHGDGPYDHSITAFDPRTRALSRPTQFDRIENGAAAVVMHNGEILVCGGLNPDENTSIATCMIFNPTMSTIRNVARMTFARGYHASCLLNDGRVLVHGGWGSFGFLHTYEIYDPAVDKWTVTMPTADDNTTAFNWNRTTHICVQLDNGRIFFSGDGQRHKCMLLDLATNKLSQCAQPPPRIMNYVTVAVYE